MFVDTRAVMGTMASVHVADRCEPAVVAAAVGEVWAELDRLESIFSTFRDASQISQINQGTLHPLDACTEVIEVLDVCTWLEQSSGGAFCARRPCDGSLDPAGLVKGWAAQRATLALHAAGLCNWYLSVGGDIQTCGRNADGAAWRVGIADPHGDEHAVKAIVEVSGGAIATSGAYERGGHIWGRAASSADGVADTDATPSSVFASITVIGPDLTWADALATTVFAMGTPGLAWIRRFDGYEAIAIGEDGAIRRSAAAEPDRRATSASAVSCGGW